MLYSIFEFALISVVQLIVAEFVVRFETVMLPIIGAGIAVFGATILVDDPPTVTLTLFD
jgi:hypothetical protein